MKAIFLESERLYYEPLSPLHLSKTYLDWLNDEDVCQFLETGGNYSIKMLENFINEQIEKKILIWAIFKKKSNKHIGNIKINPINLNLNSGEYGIMMGDKKEWGKGFAKETSIRIIKYCFESLKLSTITLGVIQDNKNAVHLYKNIGFIITQINQEVGIYNNKLCNSLRMSLHVENFK